MNIPPYRRRAGGPLARFHDEMDDLMHNFLGDWGGDGGFMPALDIGEQEDVYVINAELPGVKAEDIDISMHGNRLALTGHKSAEEESTDKNVYHVERRYGAFRREVQLPGDVDAEKIEARCTDGVLTVTLPKSEKAKPKRIEVKS